MSTDAKTKLEMIKANRARNLAVAVLLQRDLTAVLLNLDAEKPLSERAAPEGSGAAADPELTDAAVYAKLVAEISYRAGGAVRGKVKGLSKVNCQRIKIDLPVSADKDRSEIDYDE